MLKPSEYIDMGAYKGVTFNQIKESHTLEEYNNFNRFIFGQTCGYDPVHGVEIVYFWDYERWLCEGKQNKQKLRTWD